MRCSFCSGEMEKGTGMMFVKKSGAVRYYCSDRCYKFDMVYHMKNRQKTGTVSAQKANAGS
jgi:ribosomal protein L24E